MICNLDDKQKMPILEIKLSVPVVIGGITGVVRRVFRGAVLVWSAEPRAVAATEAGGHATAFCVAGNRLSRFLRRVLC